MAEADSLRLNIARAMDADSLFGSVVCVAVVDSLRLRAARVAGVDSLRLNIARAMDADSLFGSVVCMAVVDSLRLGAARRCVAVSSWHARLAWSRGRRSGQSNRVACAS